MRKIEFTIDFGSVAAEAAKLVECALLDADTELPLPEVVPEPGREGEMESLVEECAIRLCSRLIGRVDSYLRRGSEVELRFCLSSTVPTGADLVLTGSFRSWCAYSAVASWLRRFSGDQRALKSAAVLESAAGELATAVDRVLGCRRAAPGQVRRRLSPF